MGDFLCDVFFPLLSYIHTIEIEWDIEFRNLRKIVFGSNLLSVGGGAYYYFIYQTNDRFNEGYEAGCKKMKSDMESYIQSADCKKEGS